MADFFSFAVILRAIRWEKESFCSGSFHNSHEKEMYVVRYFTKRAVFARKPGI